jgi:DNA-directed RNA polymerase subunit beta'
VVELGEKYRGKRTIIVRSESGMARDHLIPPGKHMHVHSGDQVVAGDPLVEGALVPQDILSIKGEEAVQQYLLREVQGVYRSQNVPIDDKHIEIIVSQMMRRVTIEDPGDTDLLPQSVVDKFMFREKNKQVLQEKKKPATCDPLLLGITKAALQSDSFISAASFQETTKILAGAALAGRVDKLQGLKENVILGHMIPAGTGFTKYRAMRVKRELLSDFAEESGAELNKESVAIT